MPTSIGQFACIQQMKLEKLSSYLMGFDRKTLEKCAKSRSKEALSLIESAKSPEEFNIIKVQYFQAQLK